MQYLVIGAGGPGFSSLEEASPLLKNVVHPTFDQLKKLEKDKKIIAGGIPVGGRSVLFVLEASSHEEADAIIQSLPIWGGMDWEVTPLQSFAGRKKHEKTMIRQAK